MTGYKMMVTLEMSNIMSCTDLLGVRHVGAFQKQVLPERKLQSGAPCWTTFPAGKFILGEPPLLAQASFLLRILFENFEREHT